MTTILLTWRVSSEYTYCAKIRQLTICRRKVLEGLRELPFAPSVGLQDVPRMDVGEAIGLVDEEDEESEMDEVDLRLSRESNSHFTFLHMVDYR
jgi:hypothetical protein